MSDEPTERDGLCHAYSEYAGLDCQKPIGHEGDHGSEDQ